MENRMIHLGYDFFILFPGGFRVRNIMNDNADIYIVLKNNYSIVYSTTVFTLENIKMIMENNDERWFWLDNFFIVKDLSRETIYKSVDEILKDESLDVDTIFIKIEETFFNLVGSDKIREDLL